MDVTGSMTALKRTKLSAPMHYLASQGLLQGRCLDFGCGRGFDADNLGMAKFDPYWHRTHPIKGVWDTVTCIYVLNVLTEEAQERALKEIKSLLNKKGTAYVAVRRDLPPMGKEGKGCYQRFVVLGEELVRVNRTYAIYKIRRN